MINKVVQTVNDFTMSRALEKNELLNTISGQNFGVMGNKNPYVPRSAPPPGAPYQDAYSQYYQPSGYGAPPPGYGPAPRAPTGYPPYQAPPARPAPGYQPNQGYPPQPGYRYR